VTDTALSARRVTVLVGALTLLGALLRFPTLGHQSLWLDELYTRWLAGLHVGQMLDEIPRTERTPYLYYLAEWVSVRVGSESESGLRVLSAIAGTATIPVVYAAGSRLVSSRSGLVAALLVAVNPFLVWYSQEARAYALVVLFVSIGLACWAGAKEQSGWALVGWGVASALACATHYFAAFVVLPQAVWLLVSGRQSRRASLVACAAPLAVLLLHVPLVRDQSSGGVDLGGDSLLRRLVGTAKDFVVGFSFPLERAGSLVAFGLVCVGIVLGVRLSGKARAGVRAAAAIGVVALAVPVGLALVGVDYIVPRNLVVALVPLLVALGGAYAGSRAGLVSAALLAALSLTIVVSVSTDLRYGRSDWRGAGQALDVGGRPRALVVTPTVRTDLIQPYLPGVEAIVEPVRVQSIAVVSLATEGGLSGGAVVPPAPSVNDAPPGFELASTRRTATYSLAVLTSDRPRVVTPAQLEQLGFAGRPARLFLQR